MNLSENELVRATIDYLKVTFYGENFTIGFLTKKQQKLFEILKINPEQFEENYRVRGYNTTYEFDEDILIGVDPANKGSVEEYIEHYCLEISGTPYHQLEERGVDMLELLKFCNESAHRVNRIDIAIDDFGIMNLNTLKNKIRNDIYLSSFRALVKGGKRSTEIQESKYDHIVQDYVDMSGFRPKIIDGRKGYSSTWGSKTNGATELQFYDKAAERLVKGSGVTLSQWLRFEMRFGRLGNRGDQVLEQTIQSIESQTFGSFAKSLLYGLIEFKEIPDNKDINEIKRNRNMKNCPIWRDYKKFLNNAEKIKIPYQQKELEKSVSRSIKWAQDDWTSTLIKFGLTGNYYLERQGIVDYIKRKGLSYKLLAQARNYIISTKGQVLSDNKLIENLQTMIESYCDNSQDINLYEEYRKLKEKTQLKMKERDKFYDEIINSEEKE